MKKMILLFILTLAKSGYAQLSITDCNIANDVFCPVDLDKKEIIIHLHGSAGDRCGVKLISNQNYFFSDTFAEALEAKVMHHGPLKVKRFGTTTLIYDDRSISLFVGEISIKTKNKQTLRELLVEITHKTSPIDFVVLPLNCSEI